MPLTGISKLEVWAGREAGVVSKARHLLLRHVIFAQKKRVAAKDGAEYLAWLVEVQAGDVLEILGVAGQKGEVIGDCGRRDQKVHVADPLLEGAGEIAAMQQFLPCQETLKARQRSSRVARVIGALVKLRIGNQADSKSFGRQIDEGPDGTTNAVERVNNPIALRLSRSQRPP